MARPPKPWFRKDRQTWYVNIKGQLHNLGKNEEDAHREFHRIMANPDRPKPKPAEETGSISVAAVMDKYLTWCQANRSPRTYEWSRGHIDSFLGSLNNPRMGYDALKPFHVLDWVQAHPKWGANQRRGAMIAVSRPFKWAMEVGYTEKHPLAQLKKPRAVRREDHITPEQFETIVGHYQPGDPFRDLLEFMWHTGCRAEESRQLMPRHLNREAKRFDLQSKEAKGKRKARLIRLNAEAEAIVERRIAGCKAFVFENEDGNQWTSFAVSCRFSRLRKKIGGKMCLTLIRHGFATRKLVEGHDHLTVAELMGHSSTQMLERVYQHLDRHEDHLRRALEGKKE